MLNLIDCTRGLNSLALYYHLTSNGKDIDHAIRCLSGYGEPKQIFWSDHLHVDLTRLVKGWECPACGWNKRKKVWTWPHQCGECPGTATIEAVRWGNIYDWKKENGRLTFRYSKHPF